MPLGEPQHFDFRDACDLVLVAGYAYKRMAIRITKADVQPPDRERIEARYAAEGLRPHSWGNASDARYGWHSHGYTKVLYCVTGSIVFHTGEGDFALQPGDRLEIDPDTEHAATVGDSGVLCLEAAAG